MNTCESAPGIDGKRSDISQDVKECGAENLSREQAYSSIML